MTNTHKTCGVTDCNKPHHAKGLCNTHYRRFAKHGTTELIVRPIRIEGDVAYVPLTRGYETIIDTADVHLVDGVNWRVILSKRTNYATSYRSVDGVREDLRMHRVIIDAPDDTIADHKDGNGLNNRRSNLRLVTSAQNSHNRRTCSTNTSGFKGVSWVKGSSNWSARISSHGVSHWLGYFQTAEDAHAAYCEASLRLHGKYGRAD